MLDDGEFRDLHCAMGEAVQLSAFQKRIEAAGVVLPSVEPALVWKIYLAFEGWLRDGRPPDCP